MAGICFYFEDNDTDVWSGRSFDFDAWRYAIGTAGDINKAIVINKTENNLPTPKGVTKWSIHKEMPDLDGKVTYMQTPWKDKDSQSLWDFDHKTDWYVFGPANGWNQKFPNSVSIPQSNVNGACHSVHIATVVMMHRYHVVNLG